MGTTLVAARFDDGKFTIAHVGDSRIYLMRDGKLVQLTEDHSLVMEQVRRGMLTVEEANILYGAAHHYPRAGHGDEALPTWPSFRRRKAICYCSPPTV